VSRRNTGIAPVRTIVLVGFMAAGKSTVGRLLAESLGWRFVDIDAEIERSTDSTVAGLFRSRGQAAFRQLERERMEAFLREHDIVIAAGGGWAAQHDALDSVPDSAFVVWLNVSAEEAVRRAAREGDTRPLLAVSDPIGAARVLLAEREPSYGRADLRIDVNDRDPRDIAAAIADHTKGR
jgi:shikimate kinase